MILFNKKFIGMLVLFFFLVNNTGCRKFVEIGAPVTSINEDNVYNNDATAAAVLTGIYAQMSREGFSARLSFATGLSSDELDLLDRDDMDYEYLFTYSLGQPYSGASTYFWNFLYSIIYDTNSALEGLTASVVLTPAVKKQLLGEARFVRAFCYFYLVNFYDAVPLNLTTDYKVNKFLSRSPNEMVYYQIISDLKIAVDLLSDEYVGADAVSTGAIERVRPSKWTAIALLARAYLYSGDYKNAELRATEVIGKNLFVFEVLDDVFLRTSKEVIWSLQTVTSNKGTAANTEEGRVFNLPSRVPMGFNIRFSLNNTFVQQFERGDQRARHWLNSYSNGTLTYFYPYKYKIGFAEDGVPTEYSVYFRLAELYLIRAEARIRQGNTHDGIADLNVLRTRATDFTTAPENQLPQLPLDASPDQALHMLEYERMAELFTEMSHRWFDLKRTKGFNNSNTTRADEVMSAVKGSIWKNWAQLYPIPSEELRRAPNLTGHQNPGYQ